MSERLKAIADELANLSVAFREANYAKAERIYVLACELTGMAKVPTPEYVPEGFKLVPIEPPASIPDYGGDFDEELFDLCRRDDYRGLYRALLSRISPVEKKE